MKKAIVFLFFICILISCKKEELLSTGATGIIHKLNGSTFMYGTHVLKDKDGQIMYALESNKINLNKYENEVVQIKGKKIKGYPHDGGPEFIDVTRVK